MKPLFRSATIALALGAAFLAPLPAAAQSSDATTSSSTAASTSGSAGGKLASSFDAFAGSTENSTALVNGLRTGSDITLNSSSGGDSVTFTPPTKPMGYGNVRIALSLAKAQLASQGITDPTPQEIQTALMGGAGTPEATQGILQMRADGMGWGQIANSMGFKLGTVMSGRVPTAAATGTASSSGATTAAGTAKSAKGITTASGAKAAGASSASHGKGSGIVTAAGGAGGSISSGLGRGAGGPAASGVVSAQGAAHGQKFGGGGQGKGGGKL